jgi:multiple sugar transport system permease protein
MRGALAPSLARPRISRVRLRENVDAYVFIAPWLIGFVCLTAGPMLASVVLSLSDWDLLNPLRLIGPGNFVEAVKDDLFWLSLYNTAYYTFVSVPLHLVAALGAALILNMRLRWINYYRTMVYLPSITPSVASAFLWMWIFNPDFGLANAAMDLLHLPHSMWIWDPDMAKPSLILMGLWTIGPQMVILLGGLQSVPESLYEAAAVDGAGLWHKFRHITLPMLSPIVFLCLVISLIRSFQVFNLAYIMTQGGPANATLFYVLYLYRTAWESLRMGYASALAWILFLIILAFTLLQWRLSRRWVYYEGELKR